MVKLGFGVRYGDLSSVVRMVQGRYKATWKREFKLAWREAGPPNHRVISDQ